MSPLCEQQLEKKVKVGRIRSSAGLWKCRKGGNVNGACVIEISRLYVPGEYRRRSLGSRSEIVVLVQPEAACARDFLFFASFLTTAAVS